ncbi:MAG: hypothetical protein ACLS8R_07460 [Anaeromassilibacillus sp.]
MATRADSVPSNCNALPTALNARGDPSEASLEGESGKIPLVFRARDGSAFLFLVLTLMVIGLIMLFSSSYTMPIIIMETAIILSSGKLALQLRVFSLWWRSPILITTTYTKWPSQSY